MPGARDAFADSRLRFGPTPITASIMAPAQPPVPPPLPEPATGPRALSALELDRLLASIEAPATLPTLPSLPPEASVVAVTEAHIPSLRRINSLLLPVEYNAVFYKNILEPLSSGLFSRAVLWADPARPSARPKVIGGMVCRFETNPFVDEQGRPRAVDEIRKQPYPSWNSPYHAIYIQSLGILSPYRSLGLAGTTLQQVEASAQALRDEGPRYDAKPTQPMINVHIIYAHVWTGNEDGLKWYEGRGFVKDPEPVEGYYGKLKPDSAWIVKKQVGAPAGEGIVKA